MGSTRYRSYGIERKIANPSVWRAIKFDVWQAAHGRIPDGQLVCFRDGNPKNHALENLYLISRSANFKMNKTGACNHPPELKPIAAAAFELETAATSRAKRKP